MAIPADLDHLVFTCADLDAGIAWAERTFGVRPVRGGAHPQWGTHNALMSLGRERYLEILAPNPDAPPIGRANEAGRALSLDLIVEGPETIALPDGDHAALRVTPRVVARMERRQPVRVVLWMSDDGRRLPLVAEVEAGFGRVRLKLVHYQP